jgi:hypothetical protein
MSEIKFVCPFCGFESNGAGVCPTCDEILEKQCLCKTGNFSNKCCEEEPEEVEEEKNEKIMEAELGAENLSEIAQQAKKKAEEEAELENTKEVDDGEDDE